MKNNEKGQSKEESNGIYMQMEKGGLNYIKNQKYYLILSALFPIYIVIIQMVNFSFILNPYKPRPPPSVRPPDIINVLTPIIISMVISLFMLINLFYLINWKNKLKIFEKNTSEKKISLTQLFYDIIDNMNMIKKVFFCLNIIVVYYFIWYIRWTLGVYNPKNIQPLPPLNVQIFNILSIGGLLIYLVVEWKHYYQWNKKLKELKKFEKKIYKEICNSNK